MTNKNILIANSVGKDSQGNHFILFPSRWSASVGSVKSFNFYPYELAYLSTLLKRKTKDKVKMVDGNLLNLGWRQYFEKYKTEKPDYLIMESSSVVYKDDLRFALAFKKNFGTKLVFCGQHATAFPKQVLQDGVDFVCLGEYEMTVLDLLLGKNKKKILGLYPNRRRSSFDINKLPFPEDEDISRMDYSQIGGCDYKEIEFFASRGCMHNCSFCVARQVYYQNACWRPRMVSSIIREIKYLRNKYDDMEGIFFDEENHNTRKDFILKLCDEIVKNKLSDLKYDAMCGYWTLDEEMLKAMKMAGYYKIRIGVETVSKISMKGIKKNINVERMLEVLKLAKKIGIKMYGTFTFGVPGSNLKEDKKTLDFIADLISRDLLSDFQASICTPQPGTPFFDYLDKKGYLLTKDWLKYDGKTAVFEYPNYKKAEIESNLRQAYLIYFKKMLKEKGPLKMVFEEMSKTGLKGVLIKTWSTIFG